MEVQLTASSPSDGRLNALSLSLLILLIIAFSGAWFQWVFGLKMSFILLTIPIWFAVGALLLLLRYRGGTAGQQVAIAEITLLTAILAVGPSAAGPVPAKWRRSPQGAAEPAHMATTDTPRKLFEIRDLEAATTDALRLAQVHAEYGQTALVTEVVQDQLITLTPFRGDTAVERLVARLQQCRRDTAAGVSNACTP